MDSVDTYTHTHTHTDMGWMVWVAGVVILVWYGMAVVWWYGGKWDGKKGMEWYAISSYAE